MKASCRCIIGNHINLYTCCLVVVFLLLLSTCDIINYDNSFLSGKLDIKTIEKHQSDKHVHLNEKLCGIARKLQQMGNEMLNSNGKWHESEEIWIQNSTAYFGSNDSALLWQSSLPIICTPYNFMRSTVFPDATQLAMYGSSYTRELFLEMERMHYNISQRGVCDNLTWEQGNKKCHTSDEWANEMILSKEPLRRHGDCMPYHHQFSLGSRSQCSSKQCTDFVYPDFEFPTDGVEIGVCGPPGFRVLDHTNTNLSMNIHVGDDYAGTCGNNVTKNKDVGGDNKISLGKVAIGFKTYIHTPATEQLYLDRLQKAKMRHVDVAIVEMGFPWGPRGQRNNQNASYPNMTLQEEISYYVNWVHDVAFPKTLVIWVATCGCVKYEGKNGSIGVEETWALVRDKELAVVLDKRFLWNTRHRRIWAGHGCSGPVLNVLGQMMFHLLNEINMQIQG